MSTTRRKNGWQTPFNRYQINLWIVFPLIAVHYFAFLYPMLWNWIGQTVVTIIFGTAFVCASIAGCICTTVNPADNFVVTCNTEGHDDKVLYIHPCGFYIHIPKLDVSASFPLVLPALFYLLILIIF